MLKIISFVIIELCTIKAFAQQLTVQSPNQEIKAYSVKTIRKQVNGI